MKFNAKQVFWWSLVAGLGFTIGQTIISFPIELLLAWARANGSAF